MLGNNLAAEDEDVDEALVWEWLRRAVVTCVWREWVWYRRHDGSNGDSRELDDGYEVKDGGYYVCISDFFLMLEERENGSLNGEKGEVIPHRKESW